MSKNNTNKNSMDNLIRQNIIVIHNVMIKSIITNMSVLTKSSFSRKAPESIKLMNHKSNCLLHNESLSMTWKLSTHLIYKLLFVHHSLNVIPFLCNHLRNSTQSFIWCPAYLQNLQMTRGTFPFWRALSLDSDEEH
jgi:hypothetical protein